MPKGYMLASVKISDMDQFKLYGQAAGPLLKEYGGTMLAKSNDFRENANGIEEGSTTLIVEFESYEKAKEFYDSEAYQKAIPLRETCAKTTIVLLPGVH